MQKSENIRLYESLQFERDGLEKRLDDLNLELDMLEDKMNNIWDILTNEEQETLLKEWEN